MESVNFDRAADYYDATRGFPDGVAPQIGQFIAESANLSTNDKLLEIGIGTGRVSVPLASHIDMIAGVDISLEMLKVLLTKRNKLNVLPVVADGHELPYTAECFDAILIVQVLHLVPDPVKILGDVKRVLKPSGRLLHGFTADITDDNPVAAALNANRPKRRTGYNWEQVATALDSSGWVQQEETTFTYNYTEKPQTVLDAVKNKVWSSMWGTTDEEIDPAVTAIKQAVDEHYNGNFQAEMQRKSGFTLQILRPLA